MIDEMAGTSSENRTVSLAEAIACKLKSEAIDTIFGIPGTHVIELYRGFDLHGIRPVTPRHEQSVGFAATAWGHLRGLPGVAVTTSGPGLLNILAAAATAYCESRGLIVLSPGVPTGTPDARIGILHETKNPIGASGAVMAWSRRAESAAKALELLDEAFAQQAGRRAPVHIEVPIDLFTEPVPTPPSQESAQTQATDSGSADRAQLLRTAADLLVRARSPRILAGGGAAGAAEAVKRLAEKLEAPVATTINGKGILDERHPLALGAELRLEALHQDFEAADVLLIVGSRLAEAEFWSGPFAPTGQIIRIDIDPIQIGIGCDPDIAIVSGANAAVTELHDLVADLESNSRESDIESLRGAVQAGAEELGGETLALARRIASWIPDEAFISMDSSQICYLGMNPAVTSRLPKRMLQASTYSPLGMGLPGAIGAAIAEPEQKAWCVTGDGALMFSIQELVTAAEESLDLTLIVVDNGGYREIANNMVDAGIRPQGVELCQPDWTALGIALGAEAIALAANADDGEFKRAGEFAREPGLRVIHVRQGPVT